MALAVYPTVVQFALIWRCDELHQGGHCSFGLPENWHTCIAKNRATIQRKGSTMKFAFPLICRRRTVPAEYRTCTDIAFFRQRIRLDLQRQPGRCERLSFSRLNAN